MEQENPSPKKSLPKAKLAMQMGVTACVFSSLALLLLIFLLSRTLDWRDGLEIFLTALLLGFLGLLAGAIAWATGSKLHHQYKLAPEAYGIISVKRMKTGTSLGLLGIYVFAGLVCFFFLALFMDWEILGN